MADPTTTPPGSTGAGTGNPVPPGSAGQTAALVAKHGGATASSWGSLPPKPGSAPRGRPRKDGLPAGSGAVRPVAPASAGAQTRVAPLPSIPPHPAPSPGYAPAPLDPALVARTVDSILAALDQVAVSVVGSKARKVIDDDAAVAQVTDAVKLSPANRELISTNLPIVLSKHGVNSEHLPEFALVAGLGGYASGFVVAVQRLDRMAKEADARRQQSPRAT